MYCAEVTPVAGRWRGGSCWELGCRKPCPHKKGRTRQPGGDLQITRAWLVLLPWGRGLWLIAGTLEASGVSCRKFRWRVWKSLPPCPKPLTPAPTQAASPAGHPESQDGSSYKSSSALTAGAARFWNPTD